MSLFFLLSSLFGGQDLAIALKAVFDKRWSAKNIEADVWRCSVKKIFLKILQNSQENTFARDSFFIKL